MSGQNLDICTTSLTDLSKVPLWLVHRENATGTSAIRVNFKNKPIKISACVNALSIQMKEMTGFETQVNPYALVARGRWPTRNKGKFPFFFVKLALIKS
jgi:hypothetical protein